MPRELPPDPPDNVCGLNACASSTFDGSGDSHDGSASPASDAATPAPTTDALPSPQTLQGGAGFGEGGVGLGVGWLVMGAHSHGPSINAGMS